MEKYEQNLIKLENGYVLEYIPLKDNPQKNTKVIFSSFFSEFKDFHILQTLRDYYIVDKTKYKHPTKNPYVKDIQKKGIAKEKLFEICIQNLESIVEKDTIKNIKLNKNPKRVRQRVKQYFEENYHAYLQNPIFNEFINSKTQ
jgi:hypothetical protein